MTSIEIAANPDHVHIFFHSISTQNSLGILKKLKGKSGKFYGGIYPISKEWCGEHIWAPSCFHGSVGNGWDVVSKYIETQNVHLAKNASHRPLTKSGVMVN